MSQEALAEAEALLATGRVPPLEGLELSRALARAYAAPGELDRARRIRAETLPRVRSFAASLSGHPDLQQAFLSKNRDLLEA
ncbi:MAG TPA: hypothetical protein VFS50_00925 [Meiothermus sp.]|nr:hypothetical protein [Meiothermus sp.]